MSSVGTPARTKLGLWRAAPRWAVGHRRTVVIGWLVLLIGALGLSGAIGTRFANNFSLPGTESQRAADLLKRDFPAQAGDSDQIVFAARQGAVDRSGGARARRADARARSRGCRT